MKTSFLALSIIVFSLLGCDNDPDPRDEIIGSYNGTLNYYGGDPTPGDKQIGQVKIIIKKHSINSVEIQFPAMTFSSLLSPRFISTLDEEIQPFGSDMEIHNGGEITLECGAEINSWGKMCGFFNISKEEMYMNFGWNNSVSEGAAFLVVEKI